MTLVLEIPQPARPSAHHEPGTQPDCNVLSFRPAPSHVFSHKPRVAIEI